jgi:hypothetical protein
MLGKGLLLKGGFKIVRFDKPDPLLYNQNKSAQKMKYSSYQLKWNSRHAYVDLPTQKPSSIFD